MKILQFIPYFIPYPGGQEKYIYNLSKDLVKSGHEACVITSNVPKGKKNEIIDGISIKRYYCIGTLLRNPITPAFLTMKPKIKNYDILHLHNEHSSASLIAALVKFGSHTPLVITCHGQLKFGDSFRDAIVKIYDKILGRFIFNKADSIVISGICDKEYICSIDPKNENKLTIIPNSIDPEEFLPYLNQENKEFLTRYNISDKKIILFVGQVIRRKGIEFLIKAIPLMINRTSENFIILVVGTGDYLDKAKKMVDDYNVGKYIRFTEKIPFKDLVVAYKSADFFILPSLSEACPTVILEAMYFNLPIISTDIPGISDHFKDNAILVPPRDEKSLSDAMIELLTNRTKKALLAEKGKKIVEKKYLCTVTMKEYEKLFFSLKKS